MWQKIKNLYHLAQALIAAIYFNFPSQKLTVIAVSGTDGKTTTVNMIYHVLIKSGFKASMVSSIGAKIAGREKETGLHVSTPSPWQVQKLLKQAVDRKSQYFVLEATSHGLHQNRLAFVKVDTAIITNITSEHLDYHVTWQNYAIAKAKLFKNVRYSILNLDDQKSYNFLKSRVSGTIITYSKNKNSDINLENTPVKLTIAGHFNLSNALGAAAACNMLNIPKRKIISHLKSYSGTRGRIEEIRAGQDFTAIVDFAHTPNALESLLTSLKYDMDPKSKLIAVFGAAGNRDRSKRPKMGRIAAQNADITIITAEDPRTEKVTEISAQIAEGFKRLNKKAGKDYFLVNDRKKAIEFAIQLANKGDVVVTLGKGHEKSMCIGKVEYPWDEAAILSSAIRQKINK